MALTTALIGIGVLAGVGAIALARPFRRDRAAWYARLDSCDRRLVATPGGPIEVAERGEGPPILVSHGIFHGCDCGTTAVRATIDGRRVISPSRFGYLGSPMPGAPTAAGQADAFAGLLDALEIPTTDVIGISAGTSAAVQMVLRHPDRVGHLVISSGNWPGSPTAQAPPGWAKAFYSDGAMWALRRLVPPFVRQLMGVPPGFPRTDEEREEVDDLLESIFPIAPRREGAIFDAYESNPDIAAYPLEDISTPTLIIHAEDDPLASFDAAAEAADRIPTATLIAFVSGGHLGLGRAAEARDAITSFLTVDSAA